MVRDCPRNRKNNDDRKKRDQKEQAQLQERPRKESLSKDTMEHQIKEQAKLQSPRVEKILKEKGKGKRVKENILRRYLSTFNQELSSIKRCTRLIDVTFE